MVQTGSWVKPWLLPYDELLCNLCQIHDLEDEYDSIDLPCFYRIEKKNIILFYTS